MVTMGASLSSPALRLSRSGNVALGAVDMVVTVLTVGVKLITMAFVALVPVDEFVMVCLCFVGVDSGSLMMMNSGEVLFIEMASGTSLT